uniref:Reverse transcriptase domain-containing protein n=1 Tax=Bracon brevicornis TaxID=1563983 RepID=A0A6V7LX31_9HYME
MIPPITHKELMQACMRVGNSKAPGMDHIPNIALKRQILALLPKGSKPPDDPSSWPPLCMLDTAGKILERVIRSRVEAAIGNSLEDNQYGFRKVRSTIDAINQVANTSKVAIAGTRWKGGTKEYCSLAALDVRNAFN